MTRVLVIEDDSVIRANILDLLEAEGFDGEGAADGKAGIAAAVACVPDVIVCDIMMPVMDGHQVLEAVRTYPETAAVPFIFLTARAERSDIRNGMNLGADDYLTKPFTRAELLDTIRTRMQRQSVVTAAASNGRRSAPPEESGFIVRSPKMRELYEHATLIAQSNMSVLILGETGVGKDVLAHEIHKSSPRAGKPFMPLNCAARAENLLESELFGHEKGAFTGAGSAREGLFEAAQGGTVFLDEVGDLPPSIQAKLLRVLEDRQVRRLGGRSSVHVDVRFVAATNRDLEADANTGSFRRDLFFRLGEELEVPPLRERTEEVVPLAERFIANICCQLAREEPPSLSADVVAVLESYSWPGNVRELRNAVERAVAMSDVPELRPEHLPSRIKAAEAPADDMTRLQEEMRELECQKMKDALERHNGNQTRAAKELGVSRRTFVSRMTEYGLPRPRKKD